MFERNTRRYRTMVGKVMQHTGRMLIIYVALLGGVVFFFKTLPSSFLPDEDQGALMVMVQLPTGATQERTLKVLDQVADYVITSYSIHYTKLYERKPQDFVLRDISCCGNRERSLAH